MNLPVSDRIAGTVQRLPSTPIIADGTTSLVHQGKKRQMPHAFQPHGGTQAGA